MNVYIYTQWNDVIIDEKDKRKILKVINNLHNLWNDEKNTDFELYWYLSFQSNIKNGLKKWNGWNDDWGWSKI